MSYDPIEKDGLTYYFRTRTTPGAAVQMGNCVVHTVETPMSNVIITKTHSILVKGDKQHMGWDAVYSTRDSEISYDPPDADPAYGLNFSMDDYS